MKGGTEPAGLMDAACRDLQSAVELMTRAGAEDIEASLGPLTRAAQRMEAALEALRAEPVSARSAAKGALDRFHREWRTCAALHTHIEAFCARWMCARSGPGGQAYSPRGGGGFTLTVPTRRRVSVEG